MGNVLKVESAKGLLDVRVISDIMEERGWSLSDLAEESGIHPRTLYYLIRGQRTPNLTTVCILADTLGVVLDDIVLKEQ